MTRIEHDPAKTIDRLEAEGLEVRQNDDGSYRVEGTIGDEKKASALPPDAGALYWLWLGIWIGRQIERGRTRAMSQPKKRLLPHERRQQERKRWNRG